MNIVSYMARGTLQMWFIWRSWDEELILDYLGEPWNHRGPYKWKREMGGSESEEVSAVVESRGRPWVALETGGGAPCPCSCETRPHGPLPNPSPATGLCPDVTYRASAQAQQNLCFDSLQMVIYLKQPHCARIYSFTCMWVICLSWS